jgi:DNA-directed RNA polymerase I subunit RPA2
MVQEHPKRTHLPTKSKKLKEKVDKLIETCPSFRRGHVAAHEDVERLLTLSLPHVESFDFFLDTGLQKAIQDIPPAEIDVVDLKAKSPSVNLDEVDTVQFWVENVSVKAPIQVRSGGGSTSMLTPRECRELGLMYSGDIVGDFCYQTIHRRNGIQVKGRISKFQKNFGNMPIMVMSKVCHLRGKSPTELVKMKEEVSF